MSDRAELIRNALAFLSDPNTRGHPLTQRIQFLEAKGLTSAEIESVLAQSNAASSSSGFSLPPPSTTYNSSIPRSTQSSMSSYSSSPLPVYASTPAPPAVPERDWRDYFIMAVVSGGFMFGVYTFTKKYLMPHLIPPTSTSYEADSQALIAQFDHFASLIQDVSTSSSAQRTMVEESQAKVDAALEKVKIALEEAKEAENRAKADLRDIRDEVNNVRDLLPKMLDKNKEAQSQALLDLQQELKSLKALLLSSRSGYSIGATNQNSSPIHTGPASPATSLYHTTAPSPSPYSGSQAPLLASRPSIPSWQLASSASKTEHAYPTPTSTDKGKGVDPMESSGVLVSSSEDGKEANQSAESGEEEIVA